MPWRNASPIDQRTQFIADYLRDSLAITELCEHYGLSRKTGYKWIERYLRHGPAGLRSRRPRRSPNQTAEEIVTAVLDARRRHPSWGGKKLLAPPHQRHPRLLLPGRLRREARFYPAVSGVWPAHADPHGQRRAICHHDLGPALEALGLVGAPGCPPRVHRAGASRSEWAA